MSYQPPAGPPTGAPPNNQLAVASLICGALGIVFSLLCGIGAIGSIAAVVLGAIALNQINANPAGMGGKNLATIGLVLGAVGIVMNVAWRVIFWS